ncbi:hypothetical protein BpHYR1_043540 [Brachionus plicatilis]|uniref:Uncharacterized protein n=1 Tax=Brachionus plicatilis TaxID=10195 RepID=A0A3M7PD02_BRAPC|nr:hypothetical protein BpHYR1_043540 [Brachionus plicatilis]
MKQINIYVYFPLFIGNVLCIDYNFLFFEFCTKKRKALYFLLDKDRIKKRQFHLKGIVLNSDQIIL